MTALAPTLQAFFTDRSIRERDASPQTVAAYRDTWRLLINYTAMTTGRQSSLLDIDDVGVEVVTGFLDHLEDDRRNSIRTRNASLAGIHSLFRYAALPHPEHAATIQRVLAIGPKTLRPDTRHVPHHRRDRRAARRAEPDHVDRTARSCPVHARGSDRTPDLRTDRHQQLRHSPRHRRPCPMPRQRTQRTHRLDRHNNHRMAA